jgi:MFS transporter, YNFM family, putative membrane transport protein
MTRWRMRGPDGPVVSRGTSGVANRALFVAGFTAFAMLYVAQGTLPSVGRAFQVSPATSALTVSLTTLPLALGVVIAASVSERRGRRGMLVGSLGTAAVCTLVTALSPTFGVLLALRVLTGVGLAALPAVAMAYIAEEVGPGSLGSTMGLYISATGLGGLAGRLVGGVLAGLFGWQVAFLAVGALALAGSLYVALRLPPSRNFLPQPERLLPQIAAARVHLRDGVLLGLYVCGFALMGAMVAFFNFLLYRLEAPPFDLRAGTAALVFLLYLAGTVSANWLGRLAGRRSLRSLLILAVAIMLTGVLLSLSRSLPVVIVATGLVTFGFFGAHSTTSGWVGARATVRRAQASSLYLLFYHLGSSLLGFAGGLAYGGGQWPGLVLLVGASVTVALFAASRLPSLRPAPASRGSMAAEP